MGLEQDEPQVNLIEVERVHTSQDTFSIYQASARRLEDIEVTVIDMRDRGVIFGTPESFDSRVALPFFKHVSIVVKGSENFSTIVYLAGPPRITNRGE